jgi:hypothetical protein
MIMDSVHFERGVVKMSRRKSGAARYEAEVVKKEEPYKSGTSGTPIELATALLSEFRKF